MANANKYFDEENLNDWQGHPKFRFWSEYLKRPEVSRARCELHRVRDGLAFRPAKIYLHFYDKSGAELNCDEEDWDDDLNSGLIHLGIAAVSAENERERFALMLRSALRKPLKKFGDGYFNAVLNEQVQSGPFAAYPEVAELLRHIRVGPPDSASRSYSECADMIDLAIRGRAKELVKNLKYPEATAESILAGAIATYLDERFSVTNRRLMGLV